MGALLPVSLMTAGGCALIAFWLALRTGAARRAAGVSIGDGGNARLLARMRAQANFAECVPIVLVVIALVEATRGPSIWLWIAGVALLIARIAHPLGMDGRRGARNLGTAITFALLLGLGLYAAVLPLLPVDTHAVKMQALPDIKQG